MDDPGFPSSSSHQRDTYRGLYKDNSDTSFPLNAAILMSTNGKVVTLIRHVEYVLLLLTQRWLRLYHMEVFSLGIRRKSLSNLRNASGKMSNSGDEMRLLSVSRLLVG